MKRTLAVLSSILVLTVLAIAPAMQAQQKSACCGSCCPDGCGKTCCQNGCTDDCCKGK